MIIKRTTIQLITKNEISYWRVGYILDTKYRRYKDLLGLIMSFCNDCTSGSGDLSLGISCGLYKQNKTNKSLHTVEYDAIKHVDSTYLLSYKKPWKKPRYHKLTFMIRWSEGKNYIQDIDNKINQFLKQHCLFPTKLKISKEV